MIATDWESVKEFYKESFGIDGWVVEMYANLDILVLCASGASNENIEKFLEIPQSEIRKVLKDAFDFEGWNVDLPINPYKLLTNCLQEQPEHVETRFLSDMESSLRGVQSSINRGYLVAKSYWICRTVYDIERKIQDEWI